VYNCIHMYNTVLTHMRDMLKFARLPAPHIRICQVSDRLNTARRLLNNSLHRIEVKQMVKKYPSVGTRFEQSDIVKLAEAIGCDGERADSSSALAAIVSRGASRTRPLVVEAHIDPALYVSQY